MLDTTLESKSDWRANVPKVAELTRRLRGHIENSFFDVWVRGEVSTLRRPSSGHAYFTLKDSQAQLSGVLFRGAASKMKYQIEEGMEVLAHGAITVYEARGQYQMVCDAIEPCGVGALQIAFEQLKARLNAEGLFDSARKKSLPPVPRHIGIVTSATGAAVRDIIKVLSSRFLYSRITIFPAAVQGEKAAQEIVSAIRLAQEQVDRPDVLIVGRGGGSLEDLWPFNEEIVARALFQCTIPTVSAVGHEIDFTISDFVADVRAPTPSAAAEMVIPKKSDLEYQVVTRMEMLRKTFQKRLELLKIHLIHLSGRLTDPRERIRRAKENLLQAHRRLVLNMTTRLRFWRQSLERSAGLLDSLSPLRVLARGYSLTKKVSGELIKSIQSVSSGERIRSQVADGEFTAIVE